VAEQLRRPVAGGIGTFAAGLLGGLTAVTAGAAPAPDDVTSLTLYASRPAVVPDPLGEYGFPLRCSPLTTRALTRAWAWGLVGTPHGAAVVHSVSLAAPPPRGAALVVTVHDLAWRSVPEAFPRRGRRWHDAALHRALQRATRFCVPSSEVAADLVAAGADATRVEVVGEGSDHLAPPDDAAARRLLEEHGVTGPFLLSVGTLEPRKNLRRLSEAYGAARSSLPGDWPLVVVGPLGWGPSHHWAPGVVTVGRVPGPILVGLYRAARLLAYVPLVEGFGLPPVEAMRSGTPVVATPMPSIGDAAEVVDPRRADSIAAGLVAVATDEARRARLVEAGHRHVATMTWETVARRHLALWSALVAS
jgi:glycosyltransferase involved in cell wall biosynthesis